MAMMEVDFLYGVLLEQAAHHHTAPAATLYASRVFKTGSAQNGRLPHVRQMASKQEPAQTQKVAAWRATTKLHAAYQDHARLHALLLWVLATQASLQIARETAEERITIAQITSG